MTIADRLDEAMAAAGFKTQMGLARASGVPQPTIARILKHPTKKGPETDTLVKLAGACNVSVDWLREGKEPRARHAARISGGEIVEEAASVSSVELPPERLKRHWLNSEEAEHLAEFRSLTSKNRKRLRSIVGGMERDNAEIDTVDEL